MFVMRNYGSITRNDGDISNEDEAFLLADNSTPIAVRSYKRYFVGGLVILCFILFFTMGGGRVAKPSKPHQNVESSLVRSGEFVSDTVDTVDTVDEDERLCNEDEECDSGRVCCPYSLSEYLTKRAIKQIGHFVFSGETYQGMCEECCTKDDCASADHPPPPGEIGTPYCNRETFTCEAFANGKYSQIPKDGYYNWLTSETYDNSKTFHKLVMPREVHSETPQPIMDQVWYIDLNDQDPAFNKEGVIYDENSRQITIPSYELLQAGYSRSYHHYDQNETGICSFIAGDNSYSLVTPFPKSSFMEKYHTLTYSGNKNTSRGDFIKNISARQMENDNNDNWLFPDKNKGELLKKRLISALNKHGSIVSQVEAGIDIAHTWQVRRYVKSYSHKDMGSLNPSSSDSWKSHAEKATQAIRYAKDPNFKREYPKSEQHCKHFENGEGIDVTIDSVTFPLGRPFTTISGEMVTSPEYYIGFGTGYSTAHYDVEKNVLQIYFQSFAHSRQHSDIKFPGSYPDGLCDGLYINPVAEGNDYAVNRSIDGRGDFNLHVTNPREVGLLQDWLIHDEADFTLWRYPRSEVCDKKAENREFWENIDIVRRENSVYDSLAQSKKLMDATVNGMPCATSWMRSDYEKGNGSHSFGSNEIAVWIHTLGETRGDKRKEISLGDWDSWECFYQGKETKMCTDYG